MTTLNNISGATNVTTMHPRMPPPPPPPPPSMDGHNVKGAGGNLFGAMNTTMSQLGMSDASSTSSVQDPQAMLQSFVQSLMAALNSAISAQQSGSDSDGDGSGAVSRVSSSYKAGAGSPPDLQSMLKQVVSSSSSNRGLQQSYQNLLGALGGGDSSTTLSSFLQTLSDNMSKSPFTGMAVDIKA